MGFRSEGWQVFKPDLIDASGQLLDLSADTCCQSYRLLGNLASQVPAQLHREVEGVHWAILMHQVPPDSLDTGLELLGVKAILRHPGRQSCPAPASAALAQRPEAKHLEEELDLVGGGLVTSHLGHLCNHLKRLWFRDQWPACLECSKHGAGLVNDALRERKASRTRLPQEGLPDSFDGRSLFLSNAFSAQALGPGDLAQRVLAATIQTERPLQDLVVAWTVCRFQQYSGEAGDQPW